MTSALLTLAAPDAGSGAAPRAVGSRRLRRDESRRRRKDESLLHYLAVSISAAVLILILAVAALVIGAPAVVGGSAMTVLTQSMEPGLPPGTLVVVRPTPVDEIAVGDVVTYQIRSGEAAVVTHRVISKTYTDGEPTFITQGDNSDAPDPDPVRPVQIRGTLWYSIPLLGWVNNVLNGPHRTVVIAVAAGGLFLYAAWTTVAALRDRRKDAREKGADEVAGE